MAVEESGNRAVRRRNRQQMCHFPSITSSEDKFGQSGKPLSDSTGTENLLLCFLLVFRILNAFTIKTFFVPDEFWQGPEIAHRLVFGYGYLTWEWKEGLRGWTVPLIYATGYKLLACLGLDSSTTIGVAPRIIQSILASFGDLFLYKLAVQRFGRQTGAWALICHLLSWFTFYSVPRTLTNSLETVFTTIALYYWPHSAKEEVNTKRIIKALGFAAFSCILRPTAAIVWMPLGSQYLFLTLRRLRFVLKCLLPVGCLAIVWSLVLNSWLYKRLTFVELNFVKFNVVNDMATFYGSHTWHWYFTQGFPVVMLTHLIPFVGGVLKAAPHQRALAWLILWIISIYSYVHRNISMRILECPPSGEEGYVDEADQFYLNPSSWLQKEFGNHTGHGDPAHLPSHIVMYNVLSPDVALFLGQFQYSKSATFFHTHFPEGRVGSQVFVFRHIPRHS
ncbi:GPI mannosyltransferase 3-like isoform X4 [Montipora foliosa]|uniref:GPI mannosyltransferase 3-like isoform X4 n=1 Tax=Montipora foliosa TaxID=591990 RepID=UPI0035F1FE90